MDSSVVQRVELNSVEIIECKSKMEVLNKEHVDLKKENAELKEKVLEIQRYKRRWNLRLLRVLRNRKEKTSEKKLKTFSFFTAEVIDEGSPRCTVYSSKKPTQMILMKNFGQFNGEIKFFSLMVYLGQQELQFCLITACYMKITHN